MQKTNLSPEEQARRKKKNTALKIIIPTTVAAVLAATMGTVYATVPEVHEAFDAFGHKISSVFTGDSSAETQSVDDITGIAHGVVNDNAAECWKYSLNTFGIDPYQMGSWSASWTPYGLDFENNDYASFQYVLTNNESGESVFTSIDYKINDSKTNYKKAQESIEKLNSGNLSQSEIDSYKKALAANIDIVVHNEANTVTIGENNIEVEFGKLAEQLTASVKDEIKDQINGEISKVSIESGITLKSSANFTSNKIYQTAVDENSAVEIAEDGTVTITAMGTEGTNEYQLTEDDYVRDADGNLIVNEDGKLTYYKHKINEADGSVSFNRDGEVSRTFVDGNRDITYHDVEVKATFKVETATGEIYHVTMKVSGADVKCPNALWETGSRSDALVKSDIAKAFAENDNPLIDGETHIEEIKQVNSKDLISSKYATQFKSGQKDTELVESPATGITATAGAKASSRSVQTTQEFDAATTAAINAAVAQYNNSQWAETEGIQTNGTNVETPTTGPKLHK